MRLNNEKKLAYKLLHCETTTLKDITIPFLSIALIIDIIETFLALLIYNRVIVEIFGLGTLTFWQVVLFIIVRIPIKIIRNIILMRLNKS